MQISTRDWEHSNHELGGRGIFDATKPGHELSEGTGGNEQNSEGIVRVNLIASPNIAMQWTGRDLNPRPPHCECGDLPG